MAQARFAACMACRSDAQKAAGITEAQQTALASARKKGFNYRNGRKDSDATKAKRSTTLAKFYHENPDVAIHRGEKIRGKLHSLWKGGCDKLSLSIRRMTEMRKWTEGVKTRDGKCKKCGGVQNLESHHAPPLSEIITTLGILSLEDARSSSSLWDISGGITLCMSCHFAEHGRSGAVTGQRETTFRKCEECHGSFATQPSKHPRFCSPPCRSVWARKHPRAGVTNPNWKGGPHSKDCLVCGQAFMGKRTVIEKRKFCSWSCSNANR